MHRARKRMERRFRPGSSSSPSAHKPLRARLSQRRAVRRTERIVRCAEPKRGEAAAEPKPSSRWPFLRFVRTIAFFGFGRRSAKKDESSSVAPAIEVIFSADGSTPDSAQGAIMVAGATGGVGRRVVSQLLKRGDRVRALK